MSAMKKRMLFGTLAVFAGCIAAYAETCTPTNVVVAPLTDAHWTQNAPYNDYSPRGTTVFTSGWEAGCVATAAAQELYYWQWPWRLGAVHETSHPVLNESNLALRFDGNVPFDWANMQSSYGSGSTLKQRHAAAHLVLACQSLVQMQFVSGGGLASKNLPGTMEWYEYAGQVTPRASDANLAALKADFESGSPVQTGINFKGYGGHEVVGLGYATGTNSVGAAKNLIWLNLGWGGGSDGWYDLAEATDGETIIKSVQLGFRPIKSVQIEPVAPVSGSNVTLNWHLPNCYTNKISGFTVATKKLGSATTTWSDDFSTAKGRSNNTNEIRIVNGALKAWDGTASGMYIWDEVFVPTADSVLTYDVGSSYMSGMSVRFEAKVDGVWQTIQNLAVNSGKEANYYNYGTITSADPVSLALFAGKAMQLRFVVEYTSGGIFSSDDASVKIDNLSISNVKTFTDVASTSLPASARSNAFGGLTTGETYALTVTPVMSDGSPAVVQTATTTIGTPAAAPTINAVTMSPKGANLVKEGFYADIAMGLNTIDVSCSESVTSLEAFISHQSVLPQSKIEVVDNGSGSFSINIDATEVAAKWANQKMILTLKATNATGETAYKDLELCLQAPPPVAAAVWENDFGANALAEFEGYHVTDWQQTHGANNSSVTIDRNNQGLFVDFTEAKGHVTVLVKYSNLSASPSYKRVLFATTANDNYYYDRCGLRLLTDDKVQGFWNNQTASNNDADYGSASPGTVPSAGTLAFVYDKGSSGTSAYVAGSGEALSATALWNNTGLKAGDIYGFAVGGMCREAAVSGVEAAKGMTITGLAVFTNVLTVAEMNAYVWPSENTQYEGPAPTAVWVAGEFGDDRSAHGGCEFALNDNMTNALGQIVIGSSTTLGATIALPAATHQKMSMLVKYSIPSGGASAANSVPASMFSTYDLGARAAQAASSALDGYWYNGSSVQAGTYAFSNPAQTIPQDGYILISTWATNANPNDHGTAVYSGETLSALSGGEKSGLRFTGADKYITSVGIGGPTVAGAKPWAGMVIKSVALFDEWVTPSDLANYKFPVQGAVRPVDPDRYAIEPVASWVNDFKTTEKGDYSLSVSGTTAAKDDTFGGTLTIGDAAAVIDTTAASSANMTVLIKYRAASSVTTAPVVAFGGMAAVGLDVGVYTKSDKTLAVYRNFSTDNGKPYDFATAPTLSANGGYVLCARDNGQQCMAYVGASLDAMTGGTVSHANIKFSNVPLTKLGIGGNSGMAANANDMVPFTGFVVDKVVVFNGYYTPDQIRYVENPEDGDTVNIASGATWRFAAGETRTYTNIGTFSEGGTIAITNAATLAEGTYKLAEWTTPQQFTTQCAGYGKVGTLVTDGLAAGLSARLVYGARAIYLRVDDTAKQAARKSLVVWCYGDSITEGFNAQATGANYRILLYQKLEMLGYNVRSTGVYGLSNGYNSVDPSGTALTDQYRWHSAKHGATAGPTTLAHRSNLSENVDTLAIQAGTPDVALLLIGVNDLPEFSTVEPVFKAWTNVVNRLVNNLPNTKIIVSTILYSDGTRTDIDPKITNINNNYIKPLMASLPEAWQGHVFLADLNSYVKSGQSGIIYSDHLHPDWWGYDQMADGYLEKIVECYPDPDATDFPSQNPIPAAPTANQLGAANKPELAAYRAGFTKLCNIRVEKGQDVSNVVYDDMNSAAASNNLEKVGYFVEFVRDDNHAHKWVWVDMDAFGDADLASVGLPQRNYQQAVTKMHVCSNHGAIDNVAANDDSVTGWIEFSPYDYSNPQSNASAPENYGNPYDWNDTLSTSGSYGCMQVFRVMNPSSRNLYERPQLMFAFNNFQSANSNPADFGIGNFAQHFNCNNSYHTEDWTGVGGTLAKMAPDAYSVKTVEIWTKAATPAYVRDNIVTRADGTVYHGNDANRAIITNWEYQINRPVAPPAPNTIDLLYVLDRPSREYIENTKNMPMEEFFAKSTALMNQMLCRTDMDTNFWFRMVGVYPLDVQAQEVSPMLARSKNSSEPGFELVNEMRNRVGADIVFSVARNGGGIGGLAYVNSYENIVSGAAAPLGHACGFLEYSQMISWVHEIAHVMSCNHTSPTNIDVNNPRHRQFGVVVHDDNATEEPFDYRTIMTGWYYGGQTYCFSSRNHYYNGVQLSISNHVDATQVMVELAPSVAQWRPTKVPERPEITFFPQDQAEIPAGVETMVTIDYGDPEAEIYWYDATSGEGKSDARLYTGPISVVGGTWKMLYAFAKTNGVEVAESEKTATYFLTGMYGRFDYSQVLDSDGITWSMPLGDSSDFAWDKDTENFCAGESSYRAHIDMESLTNSRPSTCSATAMLTLTEARNLNFRHLDSYTNAMFSVWLDDVPVYYKKGASDTGGEWRKEVIRVESGTHRIEFVFTQTAEDRVDAQTSEGDEHALVDDEKYQRYIASLVAAETSRVWIDGFEWTPTDMTWAGDGTTGDGVWSTDATYTPWEGGVSFADDAVVTFQDLAAGSPTVAVKGVVRPSKVNFTGVNTAYTFVPQDENAFIYISNGSSIEFKTNATVKVPFRLDAAQIKSAANRTLELGNVFGTNLNGPGSLGAFAGQIAVNSKSTVIMNPGAGRIQTVGDFGKNWSYTDSDLVFTNGTVKVNGGINGGNGLFQYKRIHVKDGAVLELVTTDATGYDVAANNTIEVERGGELKIDAGDRLRRPMKLSGGKLTVSRSGSVHALSLYNNPRFTVTADSVLTNGNAAATLGFVGQDASITLQNDATLDCYVPFANGIMAGDSKNVTIAGNGTFVQNALMIQFTNKVTVASGVTFRQNAVTSGMVGKSSWDVNGTLEANAIMQVSALTLSSGATLSVKVTDANVSNAAILCDATPSLAGSIKVDAASDLANGKYAVISATGLEDGLLARVSAPALAKRATFAVEEGGLFMTVADYTEEAFTDTDYPVPYSWMMEYYPNLRGNPSENTELQAVQPAASAAHAVWECYVLGLDPTNALSRFTAAIRMEGQKPVVEYFPTNEVLKSIGAIEYILQGKPALSNDWQNVTFEEPGATNRFFRVKVEW